MISFEKEVVDYLGLPGIPKKEWNGRDAFAKGVAVIALQGRNAGEAYAVATYDPELGHTAPKVTKVFGIEPFSEIVRVYVVPNYMSTVDDVADMDLDVESKKKAVEILKEAEEIENEGVKETNEMDTLPEWVFEEIHSKEEAEAWLRHYNTANRLRGRIPASEETLKLRLYAIYKEGKPTQKRTNQSKKK